ncbi:histidine kinase [Lutibacter sp. TH_r2]|uniref:sensor histidine kinase n=1 Tax=Lutibacter sp. TH_r2 TaxID=3082083 RepID=UPI00295315F6|nr:histidine kinase [Lutibacter sp. TH_r2]MDV7187673.1 histidine kinase [Lutibacter sp. TH_r2]
MLTLLMWSFSFAQQFTNYSIKDGLPSNHIYTIRQDAKGFIWFLTDKGMVRYNGNEFKTFTTKNGLPKNDIWEAITTPDAKVWYLAKTTKLGYIENDTVQSFPNEDPHEIMNPIFTSQVENNIYPAGPRKSFKLSNGKWVKTHVNYNNKDDRTILYHKNLKNFYLNHNYDTLSLYNKNNILIKSIAFKDKLCSSDAYKKQLNDSLYIWASPKNYVVLNLNTLKTHKYSYKNQIGIEFSKHNRINTVNGEIQISGTGFVGYLDEYFQIKNAYIFPKEIKSHFALIDKNENIWFATFSNGIYKLPVSKKLNKYVLNKEKVKKFNTVDAEIYTSINEKGFYKYNKNKKDFNLIFKASDYPFSTIKIDSLNSQFFLTKNKFIQIKKNTRTTLNLFNTINQKIDNPSQVILLNKSLYAVYYFGMYKLNPTTFKLENHISLPGINKIIKFNNRLLVATNYGLKELKNDSLIDISFKNKPFTKSIISINKLSENKIVLGTDGFGAYISDFDTIYQLPKSEYLAIESSFVEKDTLWLATNEGIFNYVKKNNSYSFHNKYDISDGLPSNNINDIVIIDNDILASTNNGVALLPKKHKNYSQLSSIYFNKVLYNNTTITYSNKSQKYTSNNSVNFKIATIDFSEGNLNTSYEYKLEPIQNDWISSNSNNLTFSNLSPKNYKLKIKKDAFENEFSFKITPLWYQRILAKLLFTLFTIAFLVYVLSIIRNKELAKRTTKINTQKQLAEFELHALRSQMNPHFVFNSLNSIQYYINKNEIELSEKYLVKFSRLIRKFFDFSRDKFISLEQEISLLNNYLEIEQMRFGNDFKFKFNIDKKLNLSEQKIPSMLLQPIVENAVNHGLFHNEGKGLISIGFIYNSTNTFTIKICDNGIGLTKAKEIKENSIRTHVSKSTEIIKDRIMLLNKSKEWHITYSINELEKTNGTCVQLIFLKNG